jgi:hypothetical protein
MAGLPSLCLHMLPLVWIPCPKLKNLDFLLFLFYKESKKRRAKIIMIDKSLLAFIDLNGQIDHAYLLFFNKLKKLF